MGAAFSRPLLSSIISVGLTIKVGPKQEEAGVGVEGVCIAGDWQMYTFGATA